VVIREIHARSILCRSKVFDYVVNPYVGCEHGCTYCYARFMKRFAGHKEPWGDFVDVKINGPDLLQGEMVKTRPGKVWLSGVCDPYQPLEKTYGVTRKCLELLVRHDWPITVQTKSSLVLRDMDLLRRSSKVEVGLSVPTGDDRARQLFEPRAPSIEERIKALEELHLAGIRTFAMIAPMLPKAEVLAGTLLGKVDYVLVDRMNYHYGDWVYRKHNLESTRQDDFFFARVRELADAFERARINCQVLF